MEDTLLEGMINDSFDRHYKLIQSFRNQYLIMIRTILKNKRLNNLTLEEILAYHDIEKKILDLRREISVLNNSKYVNLGTAPDHADVKMIKTLKAFLPFMIAYYNTIPSNNNNNTNNNTNNQSDDELLSKIVPPELD
jgi:hypothetical protein